MKLLKIPPPLASRISAFLVLLLLQQLDAALQRGWGSPRPRASRSATLPVLVLLPAASNPGVTDAPASHVCNQQTLSTSAVQLLF